MKKWETMVKQKLENKEIFGIEVRFGPQRKEVVEFLEKNGCIYCNKVEAMDIGPDDILFIQVDNDFIGHEYAFKFMKNGDMYGGQDIIIIEPEEKKVSPQVSGVHIDDLLGQTENGDTILFLAGDEKYPALLETRKMLDQLVRKNEPFKFWVKEGSDIHTMVLTKFHEMETAGYDLKKDYVRDDIHNQMYKSDFLYYIIIPENMVIFSVRANEFFTKHKEIDHFTINSSYLLNKHEDIKTKGDYAFAGRILKAVEAGTPFKFKCDGSIYFRHIIMIVTVIVDDWGIENDGEKIESNEDGFFRMVFHNAKFFSASKEHYESLGQIEEIEFMNISVKKDCDIEMVNTDISIKVTDDKTLFSFFNQDIANDISSSGKKGVRDAAKAMEEIETRMIERDCEILMDRRRFYKKQQLHWEQKLEDEQYPYSQKKEFKRTADGYRELQTAIKRTLNRLYGCMSLRNPKPEDDEELEKQTGKIFEEKKEKVGSSPKPYELYTTVDIFGDLLIGFLDEMGDFCKVGIITKFGSCQILNRINFVSNYDIWLANGRKIYLPKEYTVFKGKEYFVSLFGILKADMIDGNIYNFIDLEVSKHCEDDNIIRMNHIKRPILF